MSGFPTTIRPRQGAENPIPAEFTGGGPLDGQREMVRTVRYVACSGWDPLDLVSGPLTFWTYEWDGKGKSEDGRYRFKLTSWEAQKP